MPEPEIDWLGVEVWLGEGDCVRLGDPDCDCDCVWEGVALAEGVSLCVWLGVAVTLELLEGLGERLMLGDPVLLAVSVRLEVCDCEAETLRVWL